MSFTREYYEKNVFNQIESSLNPVNKERWKNEPYVRKKMLAKRLIAKGAFKFRI